MNNLKLIHLLIRDTIDSTDTPLTESQIETLAGDIDNLYQTAHMDIPGYRDLMENINTNEATLRDLIFRMIEFEDFQKSVTDGPHQRSSHTSEDHRDLTSPEELASIEPSQQTEVLPESSHTSVGNTQVLAVE